MIRRFVWAMFLVTAVAVVAVSHEGAAKAAGPSGIAGVALVGPISPVEQPGVPNVRPLPGAIIKVFSATGRPVADVRADRLGRFRVALPAGTYLVVGHSPDPERFPRGSQQTVVVADGFTRITVRFDSGIR